MVQLFFHLGDTQTCFNKARDFKLIQHLYRSRPAWIQDDAQADIVFTHCPNIIAKAKADLRVDASAGNDNAFEMSLVVIRGRYDHVNIGNLYASMM
jgi:hypothetical protein